ncbi:MAG: EAL domain-containing protein [Lachnospiraceae bacterium]|nr:EAL domain-containing protein [Lachnospiraceae bacterium]
MNTEGKKGIENAIKSIVQQKEAPKAGLFLLVILFLVASFFINKASRSTDVLFLYGFPLPVATFAGVLSSLSNITIICLAVFYKKTGYIASMILLIGQFPLLLITMAQQHTLASLPGLFSGILAIVAATCIYIYNVKEERYIARIRQQATTHTLTGLPNRFACTELIKGLSKKGGKLTFVAVNLNNFRRINDTMGHEIGDSILVEIADRWKALADSGETGTLDFVTKLEGDEFGIIIKDYDYSEEVVSTILRFKEKLEEKITIKDYDYFMTASFGYAEYPTDSTGVIDLMKCGDAAVHEVKRMTGGNFILHYNPTIVDTEQKLEIERKLRTALDTDKVFFHLQPQFGLNHRLRGFEALARMTDEEGNFISPVDFIPVAEKTGLIDKVDIRVFALAVDFVKEVTQKGGRNLTVSFNVSVRHLMKNNFIEEIKELLEKSGVPATCFEMEITESIMMDSAEKAVERIEAVKSMGFKVAIDDFGTGFSSLSYLNQIPADVLKIDKSFIDTMNDGESNKQYVASIVSIGHILNLEVVSEGVETEAQLNTLKRIGCDYIQGYIWGKPLPKEEALELALKE